MKFLNEPFEPGDLEALLKAGPEPHFDSVTADFLNEGHRQLVERVAQGSLVAVRCLGLLAPWLYRLVFQTRSLGRTDDGEIVATEHNEFLIRFQPGYLRKVNRYETLLHFAPTKPAIWHPNICPVSGATCLLCWPGESPLEIVESLHDLLRYRIVDFRESNSLNPAACSDARNLAGRPTDDRPLFGKKLTIAWQRKAVRS